VGSHGGHYCRARGNNNAFRARVLSLRSSYKC
jgi:hypothetical protein